MNKILIIAEHDGQELNPSTAKCVSCGGAFSGDIDILLLGHGTSAAATQAAAIEGVNAVIQVEADHLAAPLAVNHAAEVIALADGYTHLLGPSTTYGKDLMPRVAALLGVNQVSDIMEVLGPYEMKRPVYAGNAIVNVKAPEGATLVGTVRVASWPSAGEGASAEVRQATAVAGPNADSSWVGLESGGSERPDLQTANVVVSGGRALGSEENFELIFELADQLGAGVGASRAAVDAGYVPNDMQVGQTGKIISPDLYFAIGISGAIQHVTGIKDAGTIVAINKDPDAPIFEIADIGLVGDLFNVLPELKSQLD
ncbi:MAG: FAD-binding protein [Gammaproteobacteria bacterium]|nr:FAD-binding protein [Gammaproteobacteria bacterium]